MSETAPIAVTIAKTGAADVLEVVPCTLSPSATNLADDEVLVQNKFAGINFIDTYIRSGLYPHSLPYTPGMEGSGPIVKVGAAADPSLLGKRVVYSAGVTGSYAAYSVVKAASVAPIPDDLPEDVAAAVLLQGLTAHMLTHDSYPVKKGDAVLVQAAAGGTGLLVSQMAKLRGATVIGVCGGAEKAALAKSVGHADHVIDYKAEKDWVAAVRAVAPDGVHAVYDGVGKSTFDGGLSLLRRRGYMITFGNASGAVNPVAPLALAQAGSVYLQRPSLFDFMADPAEAARRREDVFKWLASKELTVMIGKVFPLSQARAAHEALEQQQTTGKVLLDCSK